MATKIQINCVKALERLLEGEGEVEVEIRKSVLLEYERRCVLPQIEKHVTELVQAVFTKEIGSVDYWGKVTFKKGVEEWVKTLATGAADEHLRKTIRELVKKTVEELIGAKYIEKVAEAHVSTEVLAAVRKQLTDKLKG